MKVMRGVRVGTPGLTWQNVRENTQRALKNDILGVPWVA